MHRSLTALLPDDFKNGMPPFIFFSTGIMSADAAIEQRAKPNDDGRLTPAYWAAIAYRNCKCVVGVSVIVNGF